MVTRGSQMCDGILGCDTISVTIAGIVPINTIAITITITIIITIITIVITIVIVITTIIIMILRMACRIAAGVGIIFHEGYFEPAQLRQCHGGRVQVCDEKGIRIPPRRCAESEQQARWQAAASMPRYRKFKTTKVTPAADAALEAESARTNVPWRTRPWSGTDSACYSEEVAAGRGNFSSWPRNRRCRQYSGLLQRLEPPRRWIWTTVCCSSGRRVHCYKVPPGFTILKLKGLIMRHNHFNLSGLFDLIGSEPASITSSKTIRECRKPAFVISEWLFDPEELVEITSDEDEDVSSLSSGFYTDLSDEDLSRLLVNLPRNT
eukprot:s2670_g6.t2